MRWGSSENAASLYILWKVVMELCTSQKENVLKYNSRKWCIITNATTIEVCLWYNTYNINIPHNGKIFTLYKLNNTYHRHLWFDCLCSYSRNRYDLWKRKYIFHCLFLFSFFLCPAIYICYAEYWTIVLHEFPYLYGILSSICW